LTDNAAEQLIRTYLENVIAAEEAFAKRFREFANDGDDQEVQLAFADHADESTLLTERLKARLAKLGGDPSQTTTGLTVFLELAPSVAQLGNTREERVVQNLITAFCVEAGERAMYEALAVTAAAAGDVETEALARNAQAQEQSTAEKFLHFLPTRSKIAFNLITAHELDPAVETKSRTI
jgi:ferritin-like metal-binding protein YciE